MTQCISRKQLRSYFTLLRQALTQWEQQASPNVIFLNSFAFYHHLAPLPCGQQTIGELLQQMDGCIPLSLTEDSLRQFFSARDAAQAEAFLTGSKADFLLLLLNAKEDEELWYSLLALCEGLRRQCVTLCE